MRSFLIAIFLAFVSFLKAESSPDILFILVDDMGYSDPGCYNPDSKIDTPAIDQLAAEGMRFMDAHAAGPLCHMSRYGLLTGEYPFRTNVGLWPKQPLIRENQVTIASFLKGSGYQTAMVGKWHLGFQENGYDKPLPGGPVDRGFDSYFGIRASTDIPPYFYIRNNRAVQPPTDSIEANNTEGWSPIQGAFWRAGGIAPDLKLEEVLPRFTDEAIEVIEKSGQSDKPLFLYLAYPAPHTPWLPSAEFVGKSGAGMYGDFLQMVDSEIARVLKAWNAARKPENSLKFFSSDNGPTWYDEDVERLGHDSARYLRGMKADSWEAGHRVPFLVSWPDRIEAGSVSEATICFTDVLATFADVVGGELSEGAGPDSFSFFPVLQGKTVERPPVVMKSGGGFMVIREGEWKLIDSLGSGGFSVPKRIKPGPGDPKGQLYNLETDLAEEENLYSEMPEMVDRLSKRMKQIVAEGSR